MTTLNELEALTKATLVNPHGGYPYELYMPYITAATPATILAMIALIRQIGNALAHAEGKLTAYVGVCSGDKELTDAILPELRDALNALKEFK